MTVGSTVARVLHTGNGTTAVYSFPFKIILKADLKVEIRDASDVLTAAPVLDTDFTIPTADLKKDAGGNVTLVDLGQDWIDGSGFLKAGYTLTMRRVKVISQATSIRNQSDFYPEIHEDAFDKLCMIAQQLDEQLQRAIKIPETLTPSAFNPLLPGDIDEVTEATFIGVNATGDGLELGPTFASVFQAVVDAAASALAAANSATSASNDAAAALASANNAAASESNAAASAAAAAASENSASISAGNAATSETNAAASAAAAAASALATGPEINALESIFTGGNISHSDKFFQFRPVVGNAGAVTLDDTPFGIVPTNFVNGMRISILGTSDTAYVQTDPQDVLYGILDPVGMIQIKRGVTYHLTYSSDLQRFIGERGNV